MAGNQTTLLNTITLPELTDLVRREWVFVRENIDRNARQLFILDQIGSGQGSTKRYNEVDIETYADFKAEGTNSKKGKVGIGYNKTMTARTFSKEIEITLEMRNDNRYLEVGQYITNLSEFCLNKQDLDLTHRFSFATSTSYVDRNGETVDTTVGDGLAVLSAAHTLAFSSTTYRNRVSGDPTFSQGSYEAALLLAATQIYSNFGEKRQLPFNTIVSGDDPSTMREIKQVLESTADVDAVQAGIVNTYKSSKRHVVLPNLATTAAGAYDSTKRRWWFLVAATGAMNGWQAYLGEWIAPTLLAPTAQNNGADIHNYNWTYSTYSRFGVVTVSGRGIIGSPVTS